MEIALVTPRLHIRPLAEADLEAFAAYRAVPEVAEFQSWSAYTLDDARALWSSMNEVELGTIGHWFQLGVVDKDTDELWGDLAVHFVDDQQIEVGFTVAPAHQRQGVAREALSALLAFAYSSLGRHRVTATTDVRNVASCRVLETTGFRREAHFVDNVFFKGAWGSEYVYAQLASEFDAERC